MSEPIQTSATLPTACPLDCPDSCSLDATVVGGRLEKLEGSRTNPVTAGYICSKVRNFGRHLYGPDRVLSPALRVGAKGEGRFRDISWPEAYELMAGKFRETVDKHGAEAILPFNYGGSNGLLTDGLMDSRLFRRLGTSRLAHTICAAATSRAAVGLYGKMPGVAYDDYPEAKLIVIWGANPSGSGIHLVPYVLEALERGARLVVIDPRRTQLAKKADIHLQLRPGTDLALALALHHWFFSEGKADLAFLAEHATGVEAFRQKAAAWTVAAAAEECGIAAAQVEAFARLYAESSPAVLRCGWGQERNRNGGSATAAILALPAVAGKFKVRAGGYTASNSGAWGFDSGQVIAAEEPATRLINMNRLGKVLAAEEDPVKLLFVYNANPLATVPDQVQVEKGLRREDLFTVVFDQVKTDTALYADLLLPATTFLEHHDLKKGYGAYALQPVRPVIAPCGEAKPNVEVFRELIHRLGLARPGDLETPEELQQAFLDQGSIDDQGRQDFAASAIATPAGGRHPVQFVDSFPRTPDRKLHLHPPALEQEAVGGLYVYKKDPASREAPLALISPAGSKTVSSSLAQLLKKEAELEMSPQDAAARGIRSGEEVRVWNELGEVRCKVKVTADQREGVVELPKGLWRRHTRNGATSNALCPDGPTDLGEGAVFNDARVEVARV
jgi:anaerobic selenocysteine-containing dehydrogenase